MGKDVVLTLLFTFSSVSIKMATRSVQLGRKREAENLQALGNAFHEVAQNLLKDGEVDR